MQSGSRVPVDPSIFHITHIDNLAGIVEAGALFSDAACRVGAASPTHIGYSHIKERRLRRPVPCAARGVLGDYVPFNFCPRSVMLYVVSRGHDGYRGGQRDTDRHAEVGQALYYDDLASLGEVDWSAMPKRFWSDPPELAERRQAEFLVHGRFAWIGIADIGCMDREIAERVARLVGPRGPAVNIRPEWYY